MSLALQQLARRAPSAARRALVAAPRVRRFSAANFQNLAWQRALTRTVDDPLAIGRSDGRSVDLSQCLSTEGAWQKKGKAVEEQYFNSVDAQARKQLSEKIHSKELRQLIALLRAAHRLP